MESTASVKELESALQGLTALELTELAVAALDALAVRGEAAALGRLTGAAGEAISRAFPSQRAFPITLYGIREGKPGRRWQELFDATWSGYQRWYLAVDGRQRPDLRTARSKLAQYMPELVPTYERLVELARGDETAARMLTLWDPPRFLPGCSQIVVAEPEPILCRNYDYSPDLFECVSYSTDFTRPVIGTSDCLWGLLDGMNDAGLVVSLAFGGEQGSGSGFGIPLLVRYLLEVADTVAEAQSILERVPVNMAYNLTMMDAQCNHVTAFVGPDRAPEFHSRPFATNHRGDTPTDPAHARRFRSVERLAQLDELAREDPGADQVAAAFLSRELRSTNFSGAFGTVYTALYRPTLGQVEYHWPDRVWKRGFASEDESIAITLRDD